MKLVIDIEADALVNPKNIWCVVCKDIDTGEYHVFREPTSDTQAKEALVSLLDKCDVLIGHYILSYDLPVLKDLLDIQFRIDRTIDTLVVSKLNDYSREEGHAVDDYGREFGLEKIKFSDFKKYSDEMLEYCKRDVDITEKIYYKLKKYIDQCPKAVQLEQQFQYYIVNDLSSNGFAFNTKKAQKLLEQVLEGLNGLDHDIGQHFPAKLKPVREVTPRLTKHGTLNRTDFRWHKGNDLSEYNGGPFTLCSYEQFNPASHKQIIDVLSGAGWKPYDRTQTHIETERDLNRLKFQKRNSELDIKYNSLILKIEGLKKYGWKVNENNLSTLPPSAPASARSLAKRILLESRRRTLTEWLGLVHPDTSRIHGSFYGIGAWTHRMAHQRPNTANIPNEFKNDGSKKLLGKEMRALWIAPSNRLLIGVDADSIQFRVAVHYINDAKLIDRTVNGKKSDKTDVHSYNKSLLRGTCKSRQAAKQCLYSLILGAGTKKIASILECSEGDAEEAINRLLTEYPGIGFLKREIVPTDAKRGFFIGLDGRKVPIPGNTFGERKHLAPSGYLQCGEAVIMKMASLRWRDEVLKLDGHIVNFVHDEWQTESPNNMEVALKIASLQSDSLRQVGEELKLNCPLAGSYWNEDKKDYTIGTNWSVTH